MNEQKGWESILIHNLKRKRENIFFFGKNDVIKEKSKYFEITISMYIVKRDEVIICLKKV